MAESDLLKASCLTVEGLAQSESKWWANMDKREQMLVDHPIHSGTAYLNECVLSIDTTKGPGFLAI